MPVSEAKREYNRRYREANKERLSQAVKDYYQANKEALKQYQKDYRKANAETVKEKDRIRQRAQKEERGKSSRRYYQDNKERLKAAAKKYGEENKDRRKLNHSAWYKANRESVLAKMAADYKANPDKQLERKKALWPEIYKANRAYFIAKGRRRTLSLVGTFTQADIDLLYATQAAKCAGCKCCIKQKYEIDHVMPVSKGGPNTADNLQLLCVSCNRKKRAMLPEEWAALIGKLFV